MGSVLAQSGINTSQPGRDYRSSCWPRPQKATRYRVHQCRSQHRCSGNATAIEFQGDAAGTGAPIGRGRSEPLVCQDRAALAAQSTERGLRPEGIDLDTSTLADHVGSCAATLHPLVELIGNHVFAAECTHADDTTVPMPARVIAHAPGGFGLMSATIRGPGRRPRSGFLLLSRP